MMAKAVGAQCEFGPTHLACARSSGRIRSQHFNLSNDPKFIDKLRDVELYVDPPAHASSASVVDLQAAINRFVAETNNDPIPFTWTADPDKIIAAVRQDTKC